MNLAKVRELEDLKQEIETLSMQYATKLNAKKLSSIKNAIDDFKTYFKEQQFNLEEINNEIIASYKTMKIKLCLPIQQGKNVGVSSRLNLILPDKNYIIDIMKKGNHSGMKTTIYTAPKTEDEKLEREIKEAHSSLEELKIEIDKIDQDSLVYMIFEEKKPLRNNGYSQFDAFKEFLNSIFK